MADAQPIKIGPFTGGMNTYSDASAIADAEAVLIENYDIDIDGSLVSRPPIVSFMSDAKFQDSLNLGMFRLPSGINYFIIATQTATYAYQIGTATSPTLITNTFGAVAASQYDNKIWLVAPTSSANPGGGWDGTTFTAVATMPKGNCACIYKERMFIGQGAAGASALYFCWPLGDTTSGHGGGGPGGTWDTTANIIYVNKGDGQSLVDVRTFNNVIVCFKSNSTYIFAYDTAPTRGTMQQVSATVGVQYQRCCIEYENSLYLLSGDGVYQVSNWNFDLVNIKLPLIYANATPGTAGRQPVSVSTITHRLFVRYWDNMYVYNLKTRAWAKWTSVVEPNRWNKDPVLSATLGVETFYAVSYRNNVGALYRMYDGIVTGAAESTPFTVKILTKTYNVEVPYTYKRLFWWGVDCFSKVNINALVTPVVYARPVTWQSLVDNNLKWNQLGTWSRLREVSIDVTDSATMTSVGNTRTFVKFWKSLRFRQISFQLNSVMTGDSIDSPQHIYTLTAVIGNKQVVTAKVN